jgi:outer membrane protein OmpA-like peptidoglycan-associated protein
MWYIRAMRMDKFDRFYGLGRAKNLGRRAAGLLFGRSAVVAALALPFWLAACSHVPDAINPVAWYRAVSGNSGSDYKDDQARNQQNLDAGGNKPYPNLASVPDAPDRALSSIDRAKLQDSLIADRTNAQYSGQQLEAGQPPGPGIAATAAAPVSPVESQPAPAIASAAPPVAPSHQPLPAESALQSPAVHAMPQGEAVPPPPPPANIGQAPAGSPAPGAPMQTASTAPITLTPPAQRPAATGLAMHPPGNRNSIAVSVGDITFAPGSAALPATDSSLSQIAGLYKQTGGRIRVVGHSEPAGAAGGSPAQQQVADLDLALDRANAVAQALAQMGVPANEISVEAAPIKIGAPDTPRAEVFMQY